MAAATDWECRPARPGDASAIVNILRQSFASERIIYGCHGAIEYVQHQLKIPVHLASSQYYVGVAGSAVGGCVELLRRPDVLFLNYISVLPPYRSRGNGRRLLQHAVYMAQDDYERMELDVDPQNTAARSWYRRLGFRYVDSACWWSLPLTEPSSSGFGTVVGYSQAEVCQKLFGFSEFTVRTRNGEYVVGRLGRHWFRLKSVEALSDSQLIATLYHLDPERCILAILKQDEVPPCLLSCGQLVQVLDRMAVDFHRLRTALGEPASVQAGG